MKRCGNFFSPKKETTMSEPLHLWSFWKIGFSSALIGSVLLTPMPYLYGTAAQPFIIRGLAVFFILMGYALLPIQHFTKM
jgi:hypothetical protein